MRTFTMVARASVLANGKIADESTVIYSLVAEDYSTVAIGAKELAKQISKKEIEVTNLGIEGGKLVATNGAMDKYPLLDVATGKYVGKPTAIILNRVEVNDKLLGYTVFCADGIIRELVLPKAIEVYNTVGIANGKIRHTSDGDIISSIKGNYPLRVLEIKNVESKEFTLNTTFITEAVGAKAGKITYVGVIINCSNAADMAKMFDSLKEDNRKVRAAVKLLGASDEVANKLKIERAIGTGMYVVMTLQSYGNLMCDANSKVLFPMGELLLSGIDYSNGNIEESLVKVAPDFKLTKAKDGNDMTKSIVKNLIETVVPKLKEKGIEANK